MFTENHNKKIVPAQIGDVMKINPPKHDRPIWKPVKHGDLLAEMDRQMDEKTFTNSQGHEIQLAKNDKRGDKFLVGGSGSEIYGSLAVDMFHKGKQIKPMEGQVEPMIGFKNSNNFKFALTMFTGCWVIVCSNGMVINEALGAETRRKHTTGLDLEEEVHKGLQNYVIQAEEITEAGNKMQKSLVDEICFNNILVTAAELNKIAWNDIGKVHGEYFSPEHQKMHGEGNAWSVYNAFTQVAKTMSAPNQERTIYGVHEVFEEVGIYA
jgi:hypothetical protein